jgi:hypothetical protein
MKPAATNPSTSRSRELDPRTLLVFVGILACILGVNALAFFNDRPPASLRDLWHAMRGDGMVAALMLAVFTATILVRFRQQHRKVDRISKGMCSQCGYNLTGNVSGVCPECGCAA